MAWAGVPIWRGFFEGRLHNSLSTTINAEFIKKVEISQLNNMNGKNQFCYALNTFFREALFCYYLCFLVLITDLFPSFYSFLSPLCSLFPLLV
jgi:hypothetical protein